jgi:hypothetical protein
MIIREVDRQQVRALFGEAVPERKREAGQD